MSDPQNLNQSSPGALNTGAPPPTEQTLAPVAPTPSTPSNAPNTAPAGNATSTPATTTTANSGGAPAVMGQAGSGAPAQPVATGLQQGGDIFNNNTTVNNAGGASFKPVAANANYNAAFNDLVSAQAQAGPFNVNLPSAAAASATGGNSVIIKNIGGAQHAVTVIPHGGDTVNGVSQVALPLAGFAYLISDGVSNWTAVSGDLSTVLNPLAFGADPTGTAPSDVAFAAAIALHTNDVGPPGGEIEIPSGTFKFLNNLIIQDAPIILRGKAGGLAASTVLQFSAGTGIIVRNRAQWTSIEHLSVHGAIPPAWTPNTPISVGDVRVNSLFVGGFTQMVQIALNSGTTGAVEPNWPVRDPSLPYKTEGSLTVDNNITWRSVSNPGIWMQTQCTLRDVYVTGFPGDGFYWYGYVLPPSSTLTAPIGPNDNVINVASTANFSPSAGILVCDTEQMTYTGLTATSFTGVTRGINGTTAAAHLNGAAIALLGSVTSGSNMLACQAQLNLGRALYVVGTDSNGGSVMGLLGQNNDSGGIYDNADVGNGYLGCLMESNGVGNWGANVAVGAFQTTGYGRNVIIPSIKKVAGFLFATQYLQLAAGALVRTGGNTVTATVPAGHGFQAGDLITIEPGEANFPTGQKTVASVTATTVVYTEAGVNAASAVAENIRSTGVTGGAEPVWPAGPVGTAVHDGTAVWVAATLQGGAPYQNRASGLNGSMFVGCYNESGQYIEISKNGSFLPGPTSFAAFDPASNGFITIAGVTNGLQYQPLSQPIDGGIFSMLGSAVARGVLEFGRILEGDNWSLILSANRQYWQMAYQSAAKNLWFCNTGSPEGAGMTFFPFGLFFGNNFGIPRAMNMNAYGYTASNAPPDPATGVVGDVFWQTQAGAGYPFGWLCTKSAPAAIWQPFYLPGSFKTQTTSGAVVVNLANGLSQEVIANGNVTGITLTPPTTTTDTQVFAVRLTLKLVQNAAATATWPATITNARLTGGTFAKTTTANAIDTLTFEWDGVKWNQVSSALNLS